MTLQFPKQRVHVTCNGSTKDGENKNTGQVEIVSPLDANGNLLPSLVKKVRI